jgi:hypothetical protein
LGEEHAAAPIGMRLLKLDVDLRLLQLDSNISDRYSVLPFFGYYFASCSSAEHR